MQNYNKFLTARVSPDELKALTTQAKACGRTRSEYVRGFIKTLQDRQELHREIMKAMEASHGQAEEDY